MNIYLDKTTNTLSTISLGRLTLYFSYNTIIGYLYKGELVLIEGGIYSKTTTRDLNKIDRNKNTRYKKEGFDKKLEELLNNLGLNY